MDSFPSGSEVLAFLISPDAKMEDCSFLHSSNNFNVFILTCQIICMTVLHLFVTIFVLTFLFPCFDFTACNLHSRISGRLGLEVIRHLMKYDRPAGYQPLNALNRNYRFDCSQQFLIRLISRNLRIIFLNFLSRSE